MRVVIQVLKAVSMDPELNKLNFINLIYIMVKITIQPSTRKNKKFHAILDTGETIKNIHFGDSRYEDYTIHKDKQRKDNYKLYEERREGNIFFSLCFLTGPRTASTASPSPPPLWRDVTLSEPPGSQGAASLQCFCPLR